MYSTFDERYDCYKRVCGTEIKEAYDKLKYRYNCNFANILPSGLAGVYMLWFRHLPKENYFEPGEEAGVTLEK